MSEVAVRPGRPAPGLPPKLTEGSGFLNAAAGAGAGAGAARLSTASAAGRAGPGCSSMPGRQAAGGATL